MAKTNIRNITKDDRIQISRLYDTFFVRLQAETLVFYPNSLIEPPDMHLEDQNHSRCQNLYLQGLLKHQ